MLITSLDGGHAASRQTDRNLLAPALALWGGPELFGLDFVSAFGVADERALSVVRFAREGRFGVDAVRVGVDG